MGNKKTVKTNNPAGAKIKAASEAIRKSALKDSGFGVSSPVKKESAGTTHKNGSMKSSTPTTQVSRVGAGTRQGKALEDTAKKYGTNAAAMATALSNIAGSFQRTGVMDKRVSQNGDNPWNSSPYNEDTKIRMGVYGHPDKDDYSDDDIAKMTVSVLNAQKTGSANRDMQEKSLKKALDVYKNKRGTLPRGYDGLYDYLSKGGNVSGDGSVIRNATAAEKKELDRLKNTKLSALGLKLHLDGLGVENKKAFYEKFGNKTLDELTNKEVGSMVVNGWIDLEEIKATDLTAYMKLSSKYEAYMRSDDVRLDHQIRLGAENTARSAVQALEATGRGVVNAGAAVGDFFMEDKEKSKKITEFIKNNQVSTYIDDKYKYMPSGLKTATDIIGSSAQLVPVIGLSAINPALGMSLIGTSAFGNSYSSALNDGASKGEAFAYGVLSAAAEIAVEKLAGGVPGLGKGAMTKATERLVNSFRRPAMQKLVRVALEAGGEGLEEVTTYLLEPVFKKYTYAPDSEIDYSLEEAAYNFLGGFAGSAIFGGGAAILGYDIDPASVEASKANEAVSKFAQSAFHKGINHADTQKLLAKAEKAVKNASWYDNKKNAYMVPENLAEIFNAGKAVKANPASAQSAEFIKMYSGVGNTQVVKNDVYNKLVADKKISRREAAAMDTLAYDFGVNIEFVNNLTDDDGTVLNGEYSADGKTMKINANSTDPLFTTVLHESVHALKRGNPESFAVLSSELKRLVGTNTSEFSKAFKAVQRSYSKQMTNDAAINNDIVDEEFTSFMLSYLLDNPETLKSFARKNMNMVQKVADSVLGWFDSSIERYKNMDSSYQGALSDAVQKLQDKRKVFAEIFGHASDGYYRDSIDTSYGKKSLYAGKNADNIDVFVTDSSLKGLSYDERKNVFLDLIKNEYRGRTARFQRNGHIYYAQFSDDDIRKNIFGDKKSDKKGWKAKMNIGASGDIFDLFETLDYSHYSPDDGQKKIRAHKDLYGWYYLAKSVQIDNVVYDVIANVRLSKDGQYIYSLQLERNKKRKASPPLRNMKSIPSKTGAQHSSLNSISQKPNYDNNNITENVGNSLGNMHNAENAPSVSGGDIGRNSTAYRVYAQARSRYGLENVEDYSDVSFARADIDERNGREFRFEDNTASSAIKDKYNNSLHLSDNIVFERGEGANVEYGTGRILQFDDGGNVIIAVDSGGGYVNTITLPHEKVTFVSHNNESTISQDFRTSHPMYERAKGSFDNFVRTNLRNQKIGAESNEDIFPGFTFGDADYYLSQCSERMKLLLTTLDRMERADSGLGDPYFKYRSTEKDSNPFDVYDMSKNHILLELYDAVASYNLAKDIADVYIASGESLVDFDVLVDSLKARHAIAVGNYNFKSYREVFQEVFRNNYDAVSPLLDSFDRAKGEYARNLIQNDASIKEMCKKYGFVPGDDFDRAIQWYGEKNIHFDLTKAKDRKLFKELGFDKVGYQYGDEIDVAFDYRDIVNLFGEARAAQIAECADIFRGMYDEYLARVNDAIARIYPGQTDRLIKPRRDYFRHFRDMGDDLFSLGFALAEDAEIDPQLAGVSSRTKPKSAWASYRQERETKITDYSAVQGFYDYMKQAEYTINIDPFIKEFRMMRQVLAKRKSELGQRNLNAFLTYLDNFANLLAKKTASVDRIFTDGVVGNVGGRQVLKGARILNNLAKTNQVVLNFAVALKQALNLKNSIFFLQKPSLQVNAVLGLTKAKLYDSALMEKYEALMEKSNYLSERYMDLSFGENRSWTWKQSSKMLSFLDEFATRSVWLAAYEDGRRLKVPDPVIYADDITRRCSAGRGIGEKPLAFEAVSTNFFLSYLIENNNNWNIWRDILHNTVKAPKGGHEFSDKNSYLYYRNQKSGARKAGSMTYRMLIFMIMTTAVGDLLEEITGFRAEFDPINDAVKSYKASRDENGGLDMKKFALEIGKNVGLDFAGHRNFSGVYASALSWISDDPLLANNEFFGGVPAISVLSNTAERAHDGDWLGAGLEFGSGFLMRGGGAQLKKSIKGIADVAQGAHYNEPVTKSLVTGEKGGRAYDVEQSAENYVKGALFGSSALGEAREYWNSKAERSQTSKDAARLKEEDFESYKAQVRKAAKTDKLSAELWRVMNETGSDTALAYNYIDPMQTYADKYGNEQSFELGEKERAMYQNEQNRLIKQKYAEVVQTKEYKNADDAGKLGLLQNARTAVVGDYAEKVVADYVMKPMIDDYIAAHGEDDVVKLWKKTGDYDLLPVHDTARDKSYEFNGERFSFELSDEQIDQYNAQNSEEIGKAYQKLMSSHRWKLLSDEKKADELRAAKKSATELVSERVKWDHVYADAMAEFDARYGEDNPVKRAYEYSHDALVYPYWVLDDSFDFTYNKVKYSYDMSHDVGSYRGGVEYDALSEAYIKQFRDNYENAVVGNSAAAARLAAKSDEEIYKLLTEFKGNIQKQANELLKNYIIAKAKAGAADAQLKIKE